MHTVNLEMFATSNLYLNYIFHTYIKSCKFNISLYLDVNVCCAWIDFIIKTNLTYKQTFHSLQYMHIRSGVSVACTANAYLNCYVRTRKQNIVMVYV